MNVPKPPTAGMLYAPPRLRTPSPPKGVFRGRGWECRKLAPHVWPGIGKGDSELLQAGELTRSSVKEVQSRSLLACKK